MAAFLGKRYIGIIGTGVGIGQGGFFIASGGFDPDAQAYISAIESAGGAVSTATKSAWNDLVIYAKNQGWWSKLVRLYPFLGNTATARVIDSKSLLSAVNFNYVDSDCIGLNGLVGDGTTKALIDSANQDSLFASTASIQYGYGADNFQVDTKYRNGVFDGGLGQYWAGRQVSSVLRSYGGTLAVLAQQVYPTPGTYYTYVNATFSNTSFYNIVNGNLSNQNTTANPSTFLALPMGINTLVGTNQLPSSYINETLKYAWSAENCSLAEVQDITTTLDTFVNVTMKTIEANELAAAYFAAVEAQGTPLTAAQQSVYSQLFLDLNGLGTTGGDAILGKLDALQMYFSPSEDAARVDLISNTVVDFINTYTFTPNSGFTGDGSTGFINTKFNPTTVGGNYKLNSAFQLVSGNSAVNGHYVAGARRTSTDQSYIRLAVSGTALDNPLNASGGTITFGTHTGEYCVALDRNSSTSTISYLNGVQASTNAQASGTLLNATVIVPGFNNNPASPTALSPLALNNRTYRYYAAGASLSAAEHLQLYNSLESFRSALAAAVQAQAYFAAVEAQGGTLTETVKNEFTAFAVREGAAGRWSKIKRLYPYLGGVINSARIDAITLNQATNFNFVDADADSLIGLQGDGSTKYLREAFGSDDIFDGNFNWGGYWIEIIAARNAGDTIAWGSYDGTNSQILYNRRGLSNLMGGRGNSLSLEAYITGPLSNGHSLSTNKTANNVFKSYLNGVAGTTVTTTDANALSTADMCYFLSSNGAGVVAAYSPAKVGGTALWSGFSDADVAGFDTSYKTFLTNIQANAAAQAYFSAVESAGGSLTETVKSEFTSFVTREIENNRWNKIKRLYPFLGGVIDSARIDAITLAQATNNNFVDADADATCGLQGDGSTKSLLESENTDVIFSSINNGVGAIFDGTVTNPNVLAGIAGVYDSSTTRMISIQVDSSNRVRFYSPALADSQFTTSASFESLIGWRESSTSQKLAIDTNITTLTTPASITALTSYKIGYFGRSFNGTVFNHNSLKYLCIFLEEGMNESEILAFRTSYKTFLTNIGVI